MIFREDLFLYNCLQIAATISALPESAAKKTTATIGEREGKIRNVVQLEVIKEEQRKIEEEEKEETAKVEAKKAAEDVASAILKEAAAEAPEVVPTSPPAMPVVDEIAGGIPKLVADAQGGNSMAKIWLEFWLEKPLEFWLEIPYTKKKFKKIGSLDMLQNQNGVSSRFSSQNSSQNFFY